MGSTRTAVGRIAVVRNTLTVWKCVSVSDDSSIWVPLVGDWDVRAFGATVTESVIQLAIDSCAAAGGGTVRLPEGTFQISAGLILKTGVSMRGAGRGVTTLQGQNIAGAVIKGEHTAYSGGNRNYDATISDLKVSNTLKATAGGVGIDARQWTRLVVADCSIVSVETGIRMEGVGYYNEIRNSSIQSCVVGLTVKNGANSNRVLGGQFTSCTTAAIDMEAGPDASSLNHFTCIGTTFESNGIVCRIAASSALPISGVYFASNRLEANTTVIDMSGVDSNDQNALRSIVMEAPYASPGVALTSGDDALRVDYRHMAETRGVRTRGGHRQSWYKELTGAQTRYGTIINDIPDGAAAHVRAWVIGIDPADPTHMYEREHSCFVYRDGASAALHAPASASVPADVADARIGGALAEATSTFSIVSNDLRLNVTGETGRNMKFWMRAEWQIVNEGSW